MSADASLWSLNPDEPGYPTWLDVLEEAGPPVLHGVGERSTLTELDHDAAVTIVGARRASAPGLRFAERLGYELATAGVTVISGMALGIDAAAHRGALDAGGRTIAVLAGGPDVVYPARHRALYRRILATGAVISEHPPGTRAYREDFRIRNRIMAALAQLVVIVEGAIASGSLGTADDAAKLGRDVLAVPGQVGLRVTEGTNALLRDGAPVVISAQDVLDRLAGVGERSVRRRGGPKLDPDLARALDLVERGASTPDRLASSGALQAEEAAVALARLELLGYVTSDAAGAYTRTALTPPG
jgi:DNA processing protein